MPFTNAQKATLKSHILADPVLGPKAAVGDYDAIANAMNAPASPTTPAWRANVSPQESDAAPDYATYDSLQQGKRDSWLLFLRYPRSFGVNKVRKWVTDVWGNATANSNSEAILQTATENAKRVEVVIGGNSKNTGTVTALDRNYIGILDVFEVGDVLA